MKLDALGDRMKKYEYITRTHLIPRVPVIIRIDGKAFHSFTRGFKRPFDDILIGAMQETTKYLCENIQGCVLGYTQSDEITLVLIDYMRLDSNSWFDYNIQKCCSIAASMATMAFNRVFANNIFPYYDSEAHFEAVKRALFKEDETDCNYDVSYFASLKRAKEKGAMFDARAFNVPKEEVTNCILWRQNDATRNSIEMVGQAYFSHSELQGKSCNDIQDMLFQKHGINWNDFSTHYKRGSCCVRMPVVNSTRNKWTIDKEIPVFKGDGRKYIDDLIYVGEE